MTTQTMSDNRLQRRGFELGLAQQHRQQSDPLTDWQAGKPVLIKNAVSAALLKASQADIAQADALYAAILDGQECDELFARQPYQQRLKNQFQSLGSTFNEGDEQEIETVLIDALAPESGESIAEDLWVKASWLSFHEEDASLRFRFSFGEDFVEDVAADTHRQHYAALLSDAIFPESSVITHNDSLLDILQQTLECPTIHFVERIVYFNAPNGGAYLHHDRERGHAGVVYAQLSGSSYWLALSKQALVAEIITFIVDCQHHNNWPDSVTQKAKEELLGYVNNALLLSEQLDSFANTHLIHLINETEAFVQHLITQGHARHLQTGDAILLPQENDTQCCWHSVFCLGQHSGQALSFAMRRA